MQILSVEVDCIVGLKARAACRSIVASDKIRIIYKRLYTSYIKQECKNRKVIVIGKVDVGGSFCEFVLFFWMRL